MQYLTINIKLIVQNWPLPNLSLSTVNEHLNEIDCFTKDLIDFKQEFIAETLEYWLNKKRETYS